MSTNALQKRLRELGMSTLGARNVLMRRYQMYAGQELQEELGLGMGPGVHAYERPMMVMVDETTGNKYMRSVPHKGLGGDGDDSWLVKDMHQSLKSWGYPGWGRQCAHPEE